jgi:signal transduction histidine kinase
LKRLISSSSNPSSKCRLYIQLFSLTQKTDPQKAKAFLDIAAKLNTPGSDSLSMLLGLHYSLYYQEIGLADTALKYGFRAWELAKKTKNQEMQARVSAVMGNAYLSKRNFKRAQAAYLRAMPFFARQADHYSLGNLYVNIGYMFQQQGLVSEAEKNYEQAKALFVKLGNKDRLAQLYNNYGILYAENGQLNKSVQFFEHSTRIRENLDDKVALANSYLNMGGVSIMMKQYKKAEAYLIKSKKLFEKLQNVQGIASCITNLGSIHEETKNYPQAILYYKQSLALARVNNNMEDLENVLASISNVYKALGQYEHAYNYNEELISLKDSLYKKSLTAEIAEMQTKYETANKEQQIRLLNKENVIQKLSLSSRNKTLGIIIALFISSIGFAGLLYNRYRIRQEAKLQAEIIKQQDLATKAILDAEEKERKRIAGDLHDGVGQLFSAVKMNLSGLIERGQLIRLEDRVLAENTLALVDESCKEVRSISHQMMPNVLLRSGIASAIKAFLEKIDTERIKVNLEIVGLNDEIDNNIENVLYRIIQEAVNNVIKHSGASHLNIKIDYADSQIIATIQDDGRGFYYHPESDLGGIGLRNIETRVKYLKGTVKIISRPSSGTVIEIRVPA